MVEEIGQPGRCGICGRSRLCHSEYCVEHDARTCLVFNHFHPRQVSAPPPDLSRAGPPHPDLLPEPAGVLLAEPEYPPVPPRCQCRCQGEWNPRIQYLTCGCPPCPDPPADAQEDQRCLPCREWGHAGHTHPHHLDEGHVEVACRPYLEEVDPAQLGWSGCGSC